MPSKTPRPRGEARGAIDEAGDRDRALQGAAKAARCLPQPQPRDTAGARARVPSNRVASGAIDAGAPLGGAPSSRNFALMRYRAGGSAMTVGSGSC